MNKNSKKILISLATTILLSTSVGQAANINYKNNTYYSPYSQYNRRGYVITYNNYSNNYLQNRYNNIIIRLTPEYTDDSLDKPSNPETPVENEQPINIDKGKESSTTSEKNNNSNSETKSSNPIPEIEVESSTSIEKEVVRLVNIERQKEGLTPLIYSSELSKVARIKSQDMGNNNYFSHSSPIYGDPFTMMKNFGIKYRVAGENIAKGYSSAKSVVNGWMNSSGHRANILNPNFGKIGVGYAEINGTTYWTQMFTD